MNKILACILIAVVFGQSLHAQTLIWKGEADSDFFNEANWIVEGTENNPSAGTIDNGTTIDHNLSVSDQEITLPSDAVLSFVSAEKGITLNNTSFDLGSLALGKITLNGASTLILQAATPITTGTIRLESNESWIKLMSVDPVDADASYLSTITSGGNTLITDDNVLINQYYFGASLIRLKEAGYTPLILYDNSGQSGESFAVSSFDIYKSTQLGDFDNKTSSFRLKRGYLVTMSIFQNGTGKSEVYVAMEKDLEFDLPKALDNTVSFVRVVPWNWVTKKGASQFESIGTTWTYNWNRNGESTPDIEYAPMAWGGSAAQTSVIPEYIAKENVTHVMGFNESDNCNDQSGQYGNLCQITVAVPLFKNLMRSGLRLVSPSPRENGPFTWLKDFRDLALQEDVRYDVLGVHWYDWGGNPVNTPMADPEDVFRRFKTYLTKVHDEHQMPIWITEFNANANRDVTVHQGFLELALPYLESLDYIERYDYFEPNPEVANNREDITFAAFYEDDAITALGTYYRDFESTPAVTGDTYTGSFFLTDLDGSIGLTMELSSNRVVEGETLTISFETERSVGSAETFDITIDLADDQYTLTQATIEIPEGGRLAEVTLTAVDDDLVESLMTGSISITNLSSGIEWTGQAISFDLESEDIEEEDVVLSTPEKPELITLYPNPTNRLVNIKSRVGIDSLTVITSDGRKVAGVTHKANVLDFANVSAGLYIVKMVLLNGETIERLIHKR